MKKYIPYIIILVLLVTTIMLFRKNKKLKAEFNGESEGNKEAKTIQEESKRGSKPNERTK